MATRSFIRTIAALGALLVCGLLCTGTAGATTLVLPDGTVGPQPYQTWVDRAAVPTVPGVVTLRLDGCQDLPGCVPAGAREIALSPDWANAHVLLHELGHLFDDEMPDWARTQFQAFTGPRAWLADPSTNPPSEQFAEAYSLCARRRVIRQRTFAAYRWAPTPAAHLRACSIIRRAGGWPAR
jgi:hypothetical protein